MSRKVLVPVVDGEPARGKSFVLPVFRDDRIVLKTFPGERDCETAAVVTVGRPLSPEDIVKRLVEAGARILPSLDGQLDIAARYLAAVAEFRIGDHVRQDHDSDVFALRKVARPRKSSGLPG